MSQLIAAKVDSNASLERYVGTWVATEPVNGTCPADSPAKANWSLSGTVTGVLYCLPTADGKHVEYVWTNSADGLVFVIEGLTASNAAVDAFWTALRYP